MPLTSKQEKKVISHIRNKVTRGCPMCGEKNWQIEADLQFMGMLDSEYLQPIEGSVYPAVTTVCDNCFHVVQYSAVKIGILEK